MRHGIVAELETPESLLAVVRDLRAQGYERLDAYTPYIVSELTPLLELPRSRLRFVVGAAGFIGAFLAYLVQWLCNAVWYPLNVGGRPPHSAPAFMIITFVFGLLCAGVVALYTFCRFAGMPWFANPIFAADGFERATRDRFWLAIDSSDARYDPERTAGELDALGARRIQFISPKAARAWHQP